MSEPAISERPNAAGMYDCYLGGTAHSPADRAAAEQITKLLPEIADGAWANRGFLQRAVRWLAAEQGIRQFLDLGAGLPTQHNTHDVVAEETPDCRVLYVDIDPVVVARGGEILETVDNAGMIQGDLRTPASILEHPETQRLLDFTKPVGLLLVAVLHFIPDDDDPWELVRRYLDALPSGSYLVLSHVSIGDLFSDEARERATQIYAATATPPTDRSKTEIERFFRGLQIVSPYDGAEPELVHIGLWGADDPGLADSEGSRLAYAAVGRKP